MEMLEPRMAPDTRALARMVTASVAEMSPSMAPSTSTELACTSATTSAPPSTTSAPFNATSPEIDPSTRRSPSPAIRPRMCDPLPRTAAPWDVLLLLALAMGRCPPARARTVV